MRLGVMYAWRGFRWRAAPVLVLESGASETESRRKTEVRAWSSVGVEIEGNGCDQGFQGP